ncbi:MAG TPA: hypothetical protein VGE01_06245 [Fimbriimonas sp.]
MQREERLARRLLANETPEVPFFVDLFDMRERDLVASHMERLGCTVVRVPTRPRIQVTITSKAASLLACR